MQLTAENILLLGSILLFLSILASKTSYRLGVPALIMFLLMGMLAGSDGPGKISFNDPKLAQFIGVIALNFILFSGGLDTKWESVKPVLFKGIVLSTAGVFITAITLGLFAHYIMGFTILEGMLLGAIVSSTDAAAVFSILRGKNIGLKRNIGPTLELESGSNDPMAYFLTVSLLMVYEHKDESLVTLIPFFIKQMFIGGGLGYLMGRAMAFIINKINLDVDGLYPVLVTALVLFTFAITDFIGGNGFLAVYISAVILGNSSFIHKKSLIRFYDGVAWLMQIIMFLTLGLLVFPSEIPPVVGPGILLALFLMFIARPLSVFISLAFFKMNYREKLFISWVGLRGAVPIVFATYPLLAGVEQASMIFNLVFFITVSSVLLQGTTLSQVAKWLHLSVPQKIKKRSPLEIELNDSFKSELFEVELGSNNPVVGKSIVQLSFPKTAIIIMINRHGKFIRPGGSTVLEAGDKLAILADNKEALPQVYQSLKINPA
ncbi:MAG: potassium/proton antiporter [Cyclobacteriaceae bacterium]|nr:potassium/proton antiporter [Cyclobacteriaceae bacterium]UYN88100.1 MAG: potassium/proton antiporter [Cyclobacteriaceae bacterium]